MEDESECRHGLDPAWCAACKSPPAPKPARKAAAPKRVEKRELSAADYGLPDGTEFIDDFRGAYSFLSNFSKSPIELDGELYATVEHAFQAAKTDVASEREKIRNLANPNWAKKAGMKVTLRPGWDEKRVPVMRALLVKKFSTMKLAEKLIATGDRPLFEGNWWGDVYWGTVGGSGENILGKLLMEIRAELQAKPVSPEV